MPLVAEKLKKYKVLHFTQAPWKVGEKEGDRDIRVKERTNVNERDLYPGSYPGQVISIIGADKEYSPADLVDSARTVTTLTLTKEGRADLTARKNGVAAGRLVSVTFGKRWGAVASALREAFPLDFAVREEEEQNEIEVTYERNAAAVQTFDEDVTAWVEEAASAAETGLVLVTPRHVLPEPEPIPEPEFANLATKLRQALPKTEVHSGAGLYKVDASGSTHNDTIVAFNRNVLLRSREYNSASWIKRGTAVAVDHTIDTTDPNGKNEASKVAGINTGLNDIYQTSGGLTPDADAANRFSIKRVSTSGVLYVQNGGGGPSVGRWELDLSALSDGWEEITAAHSAVTVVTPFVVSPGGWAGLQFIAKSGGPLSFYLYDSHQEESTEPAGTAQHTRSATDANIDLTTGGLTAEAQRGEVFASGVNSYAVIDNGAGWVLVVGDPTGESGACTISPYTTGQSAADQLWTDQGATTFTDSQYIRVFAGTYAETVTPHASLNPNEATGTTLIIEGDPADDRANIIVQPGSSYGFLLGVTAGILRHLTVDGASCTSSLARATGTRFVIRDCRFINATSSSYATIRNGRIVEDCVLELTGCLRGIYMHPEGTVRRCTVTQATADTGDGIIITAHGNVEGCIVSGFDVGFVAYNYYGSGGFLLRQNTIYDCVYAFEDIQPAVDHWELINNIVKSCTYVFRILSAGWPEETATRHGGDFLLRNNCFHGYTDFAYDGVSETKTYAEFAALSLVDASGDLDATDPLLTDPGAADFSLQTASPCRRAGHGSGVGEDYLGTTFHKAHPDIGAWSSGVTESSAASGTIVDDKTGTSLTVTVDADNVLNKTWAYYSGDGGSTWTLWATPVSGDGDIQITGLSTWLEYRVQLVSSRNGAANREGTFGPALTVTVTDGTSRSWQNVCNTIRGRFKAEVVNSISGGLPTQYDNDGAFDKPEDSRWCRFSIRPADSEQVETGDLKRYRTPGVAIAQVFTKVGMGDKDALVVADAIKTAFRSVTASGVKFKTPSLQVMGRSGDEWQVNVTIPFYVDDVT